MKLPPQNEVSFRPWPYAVRYGHETSLQTDVLVLGGGIAGCHAAINAARKGAKVLVLDKGPIADTLYLTAHYNMANDVAAHPSSPASKMCTPVQREVDQRSTERI